MTPLTAEQYAELVVALENVRIGLTPAVQWERGCLSAWCFVYLVQWFHRIRPLAAGHDETTIWACDHMIAELCEERC